MANNYSTVIAVPMTNKQLELDFMVFISKRSWLRHESVVKYCSQDI